MFSASFSLPNNIHLMWCFSSVDDVNIYKIEFLFCSINKRWNKIKNESLFALFIARSFSALRLYLILLLKPFNKVLPRNSFCSFHVIINHRNTIFKRRNLSAVKLQSEIKWEMHPWRVDFIEWYTLGLSVGGRDAVTCRKRKWWTFIFISFFIYISRARFNYIYAHITVCEVYAPILARFFFEDKIGDFSPFNWMHESK